MLADTEFFIISRGYFSRQPWSGKEYLRERLLLIIHRFDPPRLVINYLVLFFIITNYILETRAVKFNSANYRTVGVLKQINPTISANFL